MATRITVKDNQSLLDITTEHYGSMEGAFDLLRRNPELGEIEANVPAGTQLWIGDPIDAKKVAAFKARNHSPATAAVMVVEAEEEESDSDFNDDFNEDFGT